MKLPITDEFLWDIYRLLDKTGDISNFILRRRRTIYDVLPDSNLIFKKYRKQNNKIKFHQLIYYLKKNNYIKVKNLQNKQAIMITKEGLNKVLRASFKIEGRAKRKDGKWIMLIFDIPQKYKKSRNLLTSVLHNLGYKMFQQSVWITPYDVSEKTEKLLQFYLLDDFIKIFLIEKV